MSDGAGGLGHSASAAGRVRGGGKGGRGTSLSQTAEAGFPGGRRTSAGSPKHGAGGGHGGARPVSADPGAAGHGARKPVKLSIRDIVDNDTGKRPTSKNLVKGLEDNVRKVLETKRVEYDRVHFQLGVKKRELEALKLELADLNKDGRALGLDKYPEPDKRLQPVRAISTRPVFSKDTNLDAMVAQLEEKKEVIQKVIHRGKIYDHMRQRLMNERVEEKRVNRDLRAALREQQLRNAELKRRDIAVSEALGTAQHELSELKVQVEKDLQLWKSEISDREAWVKQKAKFETFVSKQLQRQREIELEVRGDMGVDDEESLKAKSAASMFANRHLARKLTSNLKSSAGIEKRYEDAFRKIGVKLENLDPQTVIQTCLAQDEIRKDLLKKREIEEARVEDLKKQLAEAQAELQESMIGQERTTNRVLTEREKQLNEAEKKLEAEKSEFQFMQATVQPVKIGIQHLAKKVLDVQVDLSDAGEIEWVMDQIQARLAKIIEDTRADMSALRSASPAPDGSGVPERRHSLSLVGLGTDSVDATADTSWLMSPFNVRVKPSVALEEEDEGEPSEEDDAARAGARKRRGKKKGGAAAGDDVGVGLPDTEMGAHLMGTADSDSDEEGSLTVKSRAQLKREANKKVKLRKRDRRGGAAKDGGADMPPPGPGRRTSTMR